MFLNILLTEWWHVWHNEIERRKQMKVILTQDVRNQGKKGDIINVSDGYANNFLFARNLAVPATTGALNANAAQKAAQQRQYEADKAAAVEVAKRMKDVVLRFEITRGENGKAFGSIGNKEIADELAKLGYEVDRKKIVINQNLKSTGNYPVDIKLFAGVNAKITVEIR